MLLIHERTAIPLQAAKKRLCSLQILHEKKLQGFHKPFLRNVHFCIGIIDNGWAGLFIRRCYCLLSKGVYLCLSITMAQNIRANGSYDSEYTVG